MNPIIQQKSQPEGILVPLTPREVFEYVSDGAVILDIRPEYETDFRVFDVPKVFYLPYDSYKDEFHKIPRDVFIIVADSVGNRSAEVVRHLLGQGYCRVAYLAGGIVAWDRTGLPLSKDTDYGMSGGCACRLKPQKERSEGSSVAPKQDGNNKLEV